MVTSYAFISRIEEEPRIWLRTSEALHQEGHVARHIQHRTMSGLSYLAQVSGSIDESQAVTVTMSTDSIGSDQVTDELVRACETSKILVPVLHEIPRAESGQRHSVWNQALGSGASLRITRTGVSDFVPRMISQVKGFPVYPADRPVPASSPG